MKSRSRVILSSILSIVLCMSIAAGATFALFTSESKTNVAINSGKVEIVATLENLTLYSPALIEADGTYDETVNGATATTFKNGGTAAFSNSSIVLNKLTPGDKAEFDIVLKNNSDVTVNYRTAISAINDTGLFAGLNITINGVAFNGSDVTDWATLEAGAQPNPNTLHVVVELPTGAENVYQNKGVELATAVYAVQANAELTSFEGNEITLYSAADLSYFSQLVNGGNTFAGKTVKLGNDIDMAGTAYTPAGNSIEHYPSYTFAGTFDGQEHTISNLVTSSFGQSGYAAAGLFGTITGVVKNVNIDKATITSSHYAGGIVGYSSANVGMSIENCHVTSSTITSIPELIGDEYDNGDKAGGIIGYSVAGDLIDGCSVTDTTVKGYRDIGGIAGYSRATISNCSVDRITLVNDRTHDYKNGEYTTDAEYDVGAIVGDKSSDTPLSGNTEGTVNKGLVGIVVQDSANLSDIITENKVVDVTLPAGDYKLPAVTNKDVVISGDKDTVIDTTTGIANSTGAALTFKGVTLNFKDTTDWQGFTHSEKVVFEDCVINGTMFLYSDTEFINCTFNADGNYNVWTYGANASFTGCTFNTQGRAILVYNSGEMHATVEVSDCIFNATETYSSPKAAIEVGSSEYSTATTYKIVINRCVADAEHFKANNSTSNLWGNKNSMDAAHLNVVLDGVVVH